MPRILFTLFGLLCVFSACFAAAPPPVENFFKSYSYSAMVLSPSGRFVAALYPSNETTNIAILDIDGKQPSAITNYAQTGRVTWVRWKSDDRLLFGLLAIDKGIYRHTVNSIARDGSDRYEVAVDTGSGIIDWLSNQPNYILLASTSGQKDHTRALRLFVGDRRDKSIPFGDKDPRADMPAPAPYCAYTADHNGDVRVCRSYETDSTSRILYRDAGADAWREIAHTSNTSSGFVVLGFTPDNKQLYVLSNEHRNTLALFEFDPANGTFGKLLIEQPNADVSKGVFSWDHQLLGVEFTDDRSHVIYLDPNARQLHSDLSSEFPGEGIEIVSVAARWQRAVIFVASERSSGRYYLYDRSHGTVEEIAKRAPWIDEKEMAEVRAVHFEARDKLPLSGYLTLPPGRDTKNLPLIVNPHGGPIGIRDSDRWQPDAQFFASRGYAVLQVNFRGSGGLGKRLQEAGVGELGDKMLDDVTDATHWAITQGIADPSRICIYGASYGGYSALMGVINNPGLYRCAISYAGLTDLNGLFTDQVRGTVVYRERLPEEMAFWKLVLGSHEDDPNYMTRHSPVYNADKIKVPVFLAHGGLDVTVPSSQASRMKHALEEAGNKKVEYLYRYDEGHGFYYDNNRIELYREIEKFLKTYNPPD